MSLLVHLIRKDARAVRRVWIVWLALVVADLWWQGAGPERLFLAGDDTNLAYGFRVFLPLAELGILLLMVGMVVQEDSIVDPTAFWHTRPIGPRQLLVAKLAALGLLAIGPPLVGESLRLLWLRVPLIDIARVDLEIALGLAVPLLLAFAAAAIASDLVRYLLLLVGSVAALLIGASIYTFVMRPARGIGPMLTGDDPTKYLLVTLLPIAGVIWIMRDHFRRRDWRLAAIGVALVLGTTQVLGRSWSERPSDGGTPAANLPDRTDGWASPAQTRLRRVGDEMIVSRYMQNGGRKIAAPLVIDGLPADHTAAPWTVAGRLEYSDGTVVTSGPSSPLQEQIGSTFHPSMIMSGSWWQLESGPTPWEAWPALIEVPRDVVTQKTGVPGHYTGTFRYRLARHVPVATLPLVEGSTYADGPRRVRIDDVTDASGECWVRLEVTRPVLRLAVHDEPRLGYHFVDNLTGRKVTKSHAGYSWPVGAAFLVDFTGRGRPFSTEYVQVAADDLPWPPAPGATKPPRRCALTSLVIVRTIEAGMLTRTLDLQDLRIGSAWKDALNPR